jgi:hypothetical protein
MAAVRWVVSPTNIAAQISLRSAKVQEGVGKLALSHAARGEGKMKTGAPWTDRTGNARQGLFGEAEASATGATITLGGTVEYQPYLELGTSKMAPRPIIVPVANETAVEFTEDAAELVRRLFG